MISGHSGRCEYHRTRAVVIHTPFGDQLFCSAPRSELRPGCSRSIRNVFGWKHKHSSEWKVVFFPSEAVRRRHCLGQVSVCDLFPAGCLMTGFSPPPFHISLQLSHCHGNSMEIVRSRLCNWSQARVRCVRSRHDGWWARKCSPVIPLLFDNNVKHLISIMLPVSSLSFPLQKNKIKSVWWFQATLKPFH